MPVEVKEVPVMVEEVQVYLMVEVDLNLNLFCNKHHSST